MILASACAVMPMTSKINDNNLFFVPGCHCRQGVKRRLSAWLLTRVLLAVSLTLAFAVGSQAGILSAIKHDNPPVMLADTGQDTIRPEGADSPVSKPKGGDTGAAAVNGEPEAGPGQGGRERKGAGLRPFVPTEKIKADQAVDFPADI